MVLVLLLEILRRGGGVGLDTLGVALTLRFVFLTAGRELLRFDDFLETDAERLSFPFFLPGWAVDTDDHPKIRTRLRTSILTLAM